MTPLCHEVLQNHSCSRSKVQVSILLTLFRVQYQKHLRIDPQRIGLLLFQCNEERKISILLRILCEVFHLIIYVKFCSITCPIAIASAPSVPCFTLIQSSANFVDSAKSGLTETTFVPLYRTSAKSVHLVFLSSVHLNPMS